MCNYRRLAKVVKIRTFQLKLFSFIYCFSKTNLSLVSDYCTPRTNFSLQPREIFPALSNRKLPKKSSDERRTET